MATDSVRQSGHCVVQVHGIGLPPKELDEQQWAASLFGGDLACELRDAGVKGELQILRINWHPEAGRPVDSWGLVRPRKLRALMRGFIGAASSFRGCVATDRLVSAILAFAPLALFAGLCGWLAGATALPQWKGLRAAWPWVLSSLGFHLRRMLGMLIPQQIFAHGGTALAVYGVLLAAVVSVYSVHCVLRAGWTAAVRSVLLNLFRPCIFMAALLTSLPAVSLYLAYGFWLVGRGLSATEQLAVTTDPVWDVVPRAGMTINGQIARHFWWSFLLLALLALVVARMGRFLAPLLKLVADIVRFVGDRAYATRLVARVDEEIRSKVGACAHLVLVGHSLGSAILLRFLLTCTASVPPLTTLTLVTLGSPIRRWLRCFFSTTFPSPDKAARMLKGRRPSFAWLNVYRPLDLLAGPVFRAPGPWLQDWNTRQWTSCHGGYWGDRCIIERAVRFVEKCDRDAGPLEEDPPTPGAEFPSAGADGAIRFNRRLGRFVAALAAVVVGLTVGLHAAGTAVRAARDSLAADRRLLDELEREGVTVKGWLYAYQEVVVVAEPPSDAGRPRPPTRPEIVHVTRHLVSFLPVGEERPVAFDLSRRGELRLAGFGLDCAEPAPVHGVGKACRYPVSVTHVRGDPARFTLPTIRVGDKSGARQRLRAWLGSVAGFVAAALVFLLMGAFAALSSYYLLGVYLGTLPAAELKAGIAGGQSR